MKIFLNADPKKDKTQNIVTGEIHTAIEENTSIALEHDIFFADGLSIESIIGDEVKPLVIKDDYELEDLDDVATHISGKNYYRRIKFLFMHWRVRISYHVYGDIVKAEYLNEINSDIEDLNSRMDSLETFVTTDKDKITVMGDGSATSFTVEDIPLTAKDFEFTLNFIPLEEIDYTWVLSGTTGTLTINGFVPLAEDAIDILFRS
jgi:hypothetical protein